MVTQIDEQLSGAVGVGRRIQPTYGYYRQPNGWITFSTITRLEKLKYRESGWTPLDQYGVFDASPYVLGQPLEALFMFGGARELPLEQIVQMGLYIDPPLVPTCKLHLTQFHRGHVGERGSNTGCWINAQPVEFPQLAELQDPLEPFPCDFCEKILPTDQAREQHQSVAHKESLGNIQMGKSLGASLAEALGNINGAIFGGPAGRTPAEAQERDQESQDILDLIDLLKSPDKKALIKSWIAENTVRTDSDSTVGTPEAPLYVKDSDK